MKPRIVIGFPPVGLDIHARIIAQWMSEQWAANSVEYWPGAGGNIATETLVRAPADGHTLLLSGSNDSFNTALYDNLKYNFILDLAPVAGVATGGGVLVESRCRKSARGAKWNLCLTRHAIACESGASGVTSLLTPLVRRLRESQPPAHPSGYVRRTRRSAPPHQGCKPQYGADSPATR